MPKSTAVIKPNLGLYRDRPAIALPPGALQDGINFRVKQGQLTNLSMGWQGWNSLQLNGPVTLIEEFETSAGVSHLVLGTLTDLYVFNAGPKTVSYITPQYVAGTASASGTAVTGGSTAWTTVPSGSEWANAKAGDQISFGTSGQNDPTATWYTILSVNSATSITLTGSAGTVGSGPYTIRRLFTGAFTNPWITEVFVDANPSGQDLYYLTNGVDNVMHWNGTDATVTLDTGFGFTCGYLRQFADTMVYGNVLQGATYLGTTILNSDAGTPSAVGNAATGISNQFIVQPGTDPILAMERLGPYLAIYCAHTVVIVSATGAATIFSFRIAASNKGILGPRAVSTFANLHQFIAPDSMYQFDGSNVEPVNTQIWRDVLSSLDHVRAGNIFTFLDEQNGEQIWGVPQTTDPNAGTVSSPVANAWTEHYLEETAGQTQSALIASAMGINRPYSRRSFPFTAIGNYVNPTVVTWNQLVNSWNTYNYRWNDAFFSAQFPITLAGDSSGFLYQLNIGQTMGTGGAPLNSFVTFGRRAIVDGRMRGLLRRVYPFISNLSATLTVTCSLSDFAMGPATITAVFNYDETQSVQGQYMVPVYRRGRYVDLTFGDALGNPWQISGYDMDVLMGGLR